MVQKGATFGLLVLVLIGGAGCGKGSPDSAERITVTGTVTLNGSPLSSGTITFESQEDVDAGRAPASCAVTDGQYTTEATIGTKTVVILSPKKTGEVDETGLELTVETIPSIYNTRTTLKAEVTAEGPNKFDFPLKSR